MNELENNQNISYTKPLVTFALFAYNQEKYIREALEGALAQTYSPLEIILSDDFSSDSTFEIMEKMVAEYSGPHNIFLNRNQTNMGLADHINHVMSLANGELIVVAAGDDISYPERTSKLYDFFKRMNYPAVIFSNLEEIDNDGNPWMGDVVKQAEQGLYEFILRPRIRGATCAWDKKIFAQFPPLNSTLTAEDMALPVRAHLLGRPPKMLDEKLIKYRRDMQRIKGRPNLAVKFFWQIWPQYSSSIQHVKDAKFLNSVSRDSFDVIEKNAVYQKCKMDLMKSPDFIQLVKSIVRVLWVCGIRDSIKLLIIRFGSLTPSELKLCNKAEV